MKQNDSETEGNWGFRKNVKTCLQNKKSYLMPPSRHVHFHPILILSALVLIAGFRAGLAGLNLGYPENLALKPRNSARWVH